MEKKSYVTTDRAGYVVAGQRIPPVYEGEGETRFVRPAIGHPLQLTELEAEYELAQGTIKLAPTDDAALVQEKKSPEPAAGDAA